MAAVLGLLAGPSLWSTMAAVSAVPASMDQLLFASWSCIATDLQQ